MIGAESIILNSEYLNNIDSLFTASRGSSTGGLDELLYQNDEVTSQEADMTISVNPYCSNLMQYVYKVIIYNKKTY